MKKIVCMLIVTIIVFSLTSCSDSTIQTPANVSTGETTTSASSLATSASETVSETNVTVSSETTSSSTSTPTEPTITETVLVDEKGIKITAKKLTDGFFGPEIKLLIENNSGKNLTFQSRNASVNGYMIETMMSVDVVDGKKANDSLTFMSSDLDACHITDIADMEFSFHVFTTEDWEDYFDSDAIILKTSIADTFEYHYDITGTPAYEKNDIKIWIRGLDETDSIFGPAISVYIENNSNLDIMVQTRNVSINGFMIDGIFSPEIMAGKKMLDSIIFFSSDLEENEISDIESVELSFHILELESWDTIDDSETITISFQS